MGVEFKTPLFIYFFIFIFILLRKVGNEERGESDKNSGGNMRKI